MKKLLLMFTLTCSFVFGNTLSQIKDSGVLRVVVFLQNNPHLVN